MWILHLQQWQNWQHVKISEFCVYIKYRKNSSEIYTSRDNTKATKPGQYSMNDLYPKLNYGNTELSPVS